METKVSHDQMIRRLRPKAVLLAPLVIRRVIGPSRNGSEADARLEVGMPGETRGHVFIIETKSRSTPEAIQAAAAQAKHHARAGEWPMIQVPYLGPERLAELERDGVSGVDLCGNGIVIVPGRFYVVRTGQPNRYPDSRAVSNPFRGRAAIVGRALLTHPSWPTLGRLAHWINESGVTLSLAQASKAMRAFEEEALVSRMGFIRLREPLRMLDGLGAAWRRPTIRARLAVRCGGDLARWSAALSADGALRWAVSGESSASRYVAFAQGGPRRLAVSDLSRAASLLGGVAEPIVNFADVELLETDEPGYYFDLAKDGAGTRWASRVQAWIELQAGDARQRDAAGELREQILREAGRP